MPIEPMTLLRISMRIVSGLFSLVALILCTGIAFMCFLYGEAFATGASFTVAAVIAAGLLSVAVRGDAWK